MAGNTRINPKTGKRFDWVDPRKAELDNEKLRRDIALLERQMVAQEARENLLKFTEFTMPDPERADDPHASTYEAAEFHKSVAKHLEEVERGDIKQLIFCMPPRHGKTELATKRLAAWYSGRHPEHDIIVAAAGDDLAQDFGADTRAIMTSPNYRLVFPQHRLRKGGTAKDNIQTTSGGRLIFAGRGGQINGRGANLLLIDDLYKNDKDAASQVIRDDAWNWFTRVALKRRMGKKLVIITMTRWHSDDIIGRLTDPKNDYYKEEIAADWKIIRFPGIAEEDDVLGRAPGEALWPERFDEKHHEKDRLLDPLGFAALVQQRPTVADGVMFRRENIKRFNWSDLPTDLRYYCSSDHAVGEKQRNDPSCMLKAGVDNLDNLYLTECVWKRMAADVQVETMLTMSGGKTKPLLWWAERGHISKSIGPFLRKRMLETGVYINLVEVTPSADKQTRAQSIAARVAMGKVFFPDEKWADDAIEELLAFPNGNHDDFVDALAYIGLGLQSQFGPSKAVTKPKIKEGSFNWLKKQQEHLTRRAVARG